MSVPGFSSGAADGKEGLRIERDLHGLVRHGDRRFPREPAFSDRQLQPLDGILFALNLGLPLELRLFPGRLVNHRAFHACHRHLPVRGRHPGHGEEHEEEEHQVRGDIGKDDQPDIPYFFSFVGHPSSPFFFKIKA